MAAVPAEAPGTARSADDACGQSKTAASRAVARLPSGRHARLALRVVVSGLGGVVTELAFSDRSWWPAAVVGIAMLVGALAHTSCRTGTALGTTWGLGFFLPHLWWANVAVGPVPWLGLASLEAALIGLGAGAAVMALRSPTARRRPEVGAAVFGLVWTAAEQLRQVWPFGGFPWGRLAFSQVDGPLLGLAPLGGAPLVSFAVAVMGYVLAAVWLALRTGRARHAAVLAAAFALLPLMTGLVPLPSRAETGTLRVAAVQGNVMTPGLDAFAQAREVLGNHVAATQGVATDTRAGDVDLVLWPENASDINPRVDQVAARSIDDAARAVAAPILLGTDRRTDTERYNDMVLWLPGSGAAFAYSKQVPAAFGEYIPWRPFFRLFSPEVDRVQLDMARGTAPAVVPVPATRLGRTVTVGTPICFEVAYDAVVRDALRAGAEALVVPTNNASFGFTAESTQQLAMSRFRAVEHGRAVVQVSTVGVSGVIAPDGSLLDRTDLFTQDTMLADLPLRSTLTVADRLGDLPSALAVVASAVVTLLGWRARRGLRLGAALVSRGRLDAG